MHLMENKFGKIIIKSRKCILNLTKPTISISIGCSKYATGFSVKLGSDNNSPNQEPMS